MESRGTHGYQTGEMIKRTSFYFERDYSAEDAEQAFKDASFVLIEVKRLIGL